MPNWCSNMLTVTGPEEDLARFVRQAKGHTVSYNSIYDSENWEVFNDIRITSIASMNPEPGEVTDLSFHALYPVPAEIRRLPYDEGVAKRVAEIAGVKFSGMGGHAWQVSNWGTKWEPNIGHVDTENSDYAQYGFDTAWSPPEALIEKVSVDWPTLKFRLEYEEPGMNFAGCCEYQGGEVIFAEERECDYPEEEE